jgi:hypothetical protein
VRQPYLLLTQSVYAPNADTELNEDIDLENDFSIIIENRTILVYLSKDL